MLKPITKKIKTKSDVLKSLTMRDFSGGWNILDDELNLDPKYCVNSKNIIAGSDNCPTTRYGVRLFCDGSLYFSGGTERIINMEFFNTALIVVGGNGEILKIDANGSATVIWNLAKASALPGSPAPWGTTTFASFAQFNGELIICNGTDKPLVVHTNFTVEYLYDVATGSNLNVPICKYVTVCSRYMVMAGDPLYPNRVHISSKDTSGTWYGDPAPNDGTYIDVGSILNNASIIRGITGFRGKLVVAYAEGSVIGTLDIYDVDGNHTPDFNEAVEQYGAVSHRTLVSYGDDMLMLDLVGVPSLKRTVFTGTLKPERVSDLIDSRMASLMQNLSFLTLEDHTFAIYNQRQGQFMFFIPNDDLAEDTTETEGFAFTYRPSLKISRWSSLRGWNWTCGCRSLAGRIFFGDKQGKIWIYGDELDPISVDYLDDPTVNSGSGEPIEFVYETPWLDINKRFKTKTSKYIGFDCRGDAQFTCEMYVDRYLKDSNGDDAPALSTDFYGASPAGFGNGPQPYGGGLNTSNEQLYSWPAKFMLAKIKLRGLVTETLKIVSISMHYQDGGINR